MNRADVGAPIIIPTWEQGLLPVGLTASIATSRVTSGVIVLSFSTNFKSFLLLPLFLLICTSKYWHMHQVARGFSRGTFEVKPFAEENTKDNQQVALSRLRPTEARTYIPNTKLTLFPVKKWQNRGK